MERSQIRHFKDESDDTMLNIGERSAYLLKILVEQYLSDGQPISSSRIADESQISVSSATVRNNMARLQELGLVSSPHTSAGRIPTQHGLRFFVDGLMTYDSIDEESQQQVRDGLAHKQSQQALLESASQILSDLTQLAGLVTIPLAEQNALRQVEFLQLTGRQVLAILVVNDRDVQNRVIETNRVYTEVELRQAANYINESFAGRSLEAVRSGILTSMSEDKTQINELLERAFDIASKTFIEAEHDFVLSGESNLVTLTSSADEIKRLLAAFESKSSIVHLLDACIEGEGVQLYIGEESGFAPFDDYSLVTAPYEVRGRVAGVLGVIGPTRMSYQRVVPLLDITSRILGEVIERN